MPTVEICARFAVAPARWNQFQALVATAAAPCAQLRAETIRFDWFVLDASGEALCIALYRDPQALDAHHARLRACYGDLAEFALHPPDHLVAAAQSGRPSTSKRGLVFREGLASLPTPSPPARAGSETIEIVTRFDILPGRLEIFQELATALANVVRTTDTGTIRYDWFYHDADLHCVAMDVYAGAEGMFSHMRNCHDPHERLLEHAVMVTEFLGELPAEAARAVARYSPRIFAQLHS